MRERFQNIRSRIKFPRRSTPRVFSDLKDLEKAIIMVRKNTHLTVEQDQALIEAGRKAALDVLTLPYMGASNEVKLALAQKYRNSAETLQTKKSETKMTSASILIHAANRLENSTRERL